MSKITFAEFKESILRAVNTTEKEVKAEDLYFSQTTTAYYADHRPNFPKKCSADWLISCNNLTGAATMSADTACIPIRMEFADLDALLNDRFYEP